MRKGRGKMKPSNQLGLKTAIPVTYGVLLLILFIAIYNSEWYPAGIFALLLVSFTIFLVIRGEPWEKLKLSLGGIEVSRGLKDVVKEGRRIKISRKAKEQATDTLEKIRKDTTNPRLKLIGMWIETEGKLRELGKAIGFSEIEYHRPLGFRHLMRALKEKEILSEWLSESLYVFYNYRNRAVHGVEISKRENDWGMELAGKILARLNEELKRIQDLKK